MNSIRGFNPQRFFLLIRNTLFLERSFILIFSAVIGGILILFSTISAMGSPNPSFYPKFYSKILYFGGFIIAGNIFKELHHETKGAAWLVLPGSIFEKFTSRLVLTTGVFSAGIMMLCFLVSLISEGINHSLIGRGHDLFNPFSEETLIITLIYFILQSIFFLGGLYFKKHVLMKTILVLVIYSFVVSIIIGISAKILYINPFPGYPFMHITPDSLRPIHELFLENNALAQILSITKWAIYIGFWYLLAPLCWVIAYIRLKEKEI